MDEISMTENSNRSVGDSQENVIYRRVVKTLTNRYAEFFTRIIRRQFHPQLVVKWVGLDESEDLKAKADVLNIGVNAGAISRSYMAR
ncbi:hypothetical protein, partial [Shewanella algae]|uniref:hypothetical protein n=1 Tax=Shewanella algae TaxID=38313 RepID=UPI00313E2C13